MTVCTETQTLAGADISEMETRRGRGEEWRIHHNVTGAKQNKTWKMKKSGVSLKNHPEASTGATQGKCGQVTRNTIPPPAGQVLSTQEESESGEASGWSF